MILKTTSTLIFTIQLKLNSHNITDILYSKIKFAIVLFIFFSCSSRKEHSHIERDDIVNDLYIEILNSNKDDTIINDQTYETTIFLNDSSLFSIAKQNGIDNYLSFTFDVDTNPNKYSNTKNKYKAVLLGDTGVVKFHVFIPELKKGKIVPYYWQFEAVIKYKNPKSAFDVAYAQEGRIYVKGN